MTIESYISKAVAAATESAHGDGAAKGRVIRIVMAPPIKPIDGSCRTTGAEA
jgi:hypothetical protein